MVTSSVQRACEKHGGAQMLVVGQVQVQVQVQEILIISFWAMGVAIQLTQ